MIFKMNINKTEYNKVRLNINFKRLNAYHKRDSSCATIV